MDLIQFKTKFIDDTIDLLQNMESDLLTLEKNTDDIELVNQIFRAMHTIKGVASMYGFENISEITHYLENIYDLIRENEIIVTKEIIDLSFQTSDLIKKIFDDENLEKPQNLNEFNSLSDKFNNITKLKKLEPSKIKKLNSITNKSINTYYILFYPDDTFFKRNINLLLTFKDLFALGQYLIYKPDLKKDIDIWNISLVTDATEEQIENALFFILDNCKIIHICNFNLFDENKHNTNIVENENTIENTVFLILNDKSYKDKLLQKKITEKKEKSEEQKIQTQQDKNLKSNGLENIDFGIENAKSKLTRISIDSTKLDTLMYLVSELITTNSQLALSTKSTKYEELKPYLEKIDTLSKNFRNNALDIRLVPLNDLVIRFKRLIRDISQNLGKEIDFETQGTETELDKSTIDILAEPLMHLIRNSIDHGIEPPEERILKGKNQKGIIKLTAYNSGNYIFIQIQDDGKGININEIRKKAIEKGFISSDKEMTKKEILDIIFMPGFSTAQNLTQVSGRGVGMDIVRKKISEVRGEITIDTEIGLGTSLTIKLSQSIAILDTMLIKCENNYFMIPISDVVICERVEKDLILKPNSTHTIPYRDNLIPFIDLREIFELAEKHPPKVKTVILKRQDKYLAIITDKIIGAHQAVLKSLGHTFKQHKLISSGSLLGDGNIAYLLDTMELFKNA